MESPRRNTPQVTGGVVHNSRASTSGMLLVPDFHFLFPDISFGKSAVSQMTTKFLSCRDDSVLLSVDTANAGPGPDS